MLPRCYLEILEQITALPNSAVIPIQVAALHEGVSPRTIRRTYPLEKVSANRVGVRLGILRKRAAMSAA